MKPKPVSAAVMGMSLSHVTKEGLVGVVCERIALGQYKRALAVFTPNTEQIVMAREDGAFWRVLEAGEVRVPDSVGLVWADWWRAFVTGQPWLVRERVAGVDAAETLLSEAVVRGWKVVVIGGAEQTATKAVSNLKRRFGGLDIWGIEVGRVEIGRKKKEVRSKNVFCGLHKTMVRLVGREIKCMLSAFVSDVSLFRLFQPDRQSDNFGG